MRFIATILFALAICCGCQSTALQSDESKSLGGGRVESTFDMPVADLADHARSVLIKHELFLTQYTADAKAGQIIAYTRQGQRVELDIRPASKGSQLVIVTAGNNGDQISTDLTRAIRSGK